MRGSLAVRTPVQTKSLDMSGTNVTTAAWVTLIASLTYGIDAFEIFNPSAATMQIATGAAGQEKVLPYSIIPGGSAFLIPFNISAGSRISLKAVDQNATSNLLTINCFQ